MIKHPRYPLEQLGVDGRTAKDVVDVVSATIKLRCQPNHGYVFWLTVELLFDYLPNMDHRVPPDDDTSRPKMHSQAIDYKYNRKARDDFAAYPN